MRRRMAQSWAIGRHPDQLRQSRDLGTRKDDPPEGPRPPTRRARFRRLPARFFYSGDLDCLEKYRRRHERNVEQSNG